jgi:hypothetical protein
MDAYYESAGDQYVFTDETGHKKGHDRVYIDDVNRVYADLDGAGGSELSHSIMRRLPAVIAKHAALRNELPTQFMTEVVSEIDRLPQRYQRKSTGALACLDILGKNVLITYANAGDSYLYLFDHDRNALEQLAHTPSFVIPGTDIIDTSTFLGNARNRYRAQRIVGQKVLPREAQWTLIGMSDGVRDDDGYGISEAGMADIIRTTPTADVPAAILDTVEKYDDASLFVVRYSTKLSLPVQAHAELMPSRQ